MKRIILSVVMLLSCFYALAGGGWTKAKKEGFIKLSQNYVGGNRFFSPNGDITDITTIQFYSTSIFAEYGITDKLTGIVYVPFYVRNTLNAIEFNQSGKRQEGDKLNSFGDSDIGLQYALVKNKPYVASVSLILGLPLGIVGGGETGILQSGDGEFNQYLKVDVSHSFSKGKYFVSFYSGFNNRTNGFSDEVRFGAEIGGIYGKFIPILKLNNVFSLYNGDGSNIQNALFSNNTEYVSPTIELNYNVKKKIGISGSIGLAPYAKNIIAAPNFSLGIYASF